MMFPRYPKAITGQMAEGVSLAFEDRMDSLRRRVTVTLEMSAFQSPYRGIFRLSTQLIKPSYHVALG